VENAASVYDITGKEENCLDAYSRQKQKRHTTEQSKNTYKHTLSNHAFFSNY